MRIVDWDRPAPGGLLAFAGYVALAVGVAAAFWLYGQQQSEIQETNERINHDICVEQNRMRKAIIEVQRERQPLPAPDGADTVLQETIREYNERQDRHIDRFEERMAPLDCGDRRVDADDL